LIYAADQSGIETGCISRGQSKGALQIVALERAGHAGDFDLAGVSVPGEVVPPPHYILAILE
jgi:hypothetical protein